MTLTDMEALAPEAAPGIRILPIVHDRVELAAVVRAVLDTLRPAAVAVELPTTLAEAADRAVARLPKISLVVSEEPGEDALVWAVAPGDPLAETLRWAREKGRKRYYIDPDIPYGERQPDPVPDPYALLDLDPGRYLGMLAEAAGREPAAPSDLQREAGMAFHLKAAAEEIRSETGVGDRGPGVEDGSGGLLAVVGAAHALRLAARLASPAAVPLARTRRTAISVRHLHPESLTALLPDPPLAHAVWELLRRGRLPEPPPLAATRARRLSLVKHGLRVISRGEDSWGSERKRRVAEYAAAKGWRPGPGGVKIPDRRALGRAVWAVGAISYGEQTQEEASPWQRRLFFDFARRYARTRGQLAPGIFEWTVAGRGVGDDNLAWEIFEVARTFPWQQEDADLATVRVDGSELDLGTRKIRFRRRFFRVKSRPIAVPVRERPATDDPEKWIEGFQGGLCSYPPEDLVVEDYGRFLRRKATGLLAAERSTSEPFSSSLLDGIDLRETLHNFHKGELWVHELGRSPGKAGSVVVILDRDLGSDKYPYLMTWLGEHRQESDMAFYSTHPAEQVVGPGIMRATYGGFVMTTPPGRLFDVWQDPDYARAREKAEVLILAAVDYSEEKLIVHVAKSPPAEHLRRYAAGRGKRLVHIPLGSLSPVTLKKVRVLHILAGHDKRAIAGKYVW